MLTEEFINIFSQPWICQIRSPFILGRGGQLFSTRIQDKKPPRGVVRKGFKWNGYQRFPLKNGVNGFLVSTVEEAGKGMVQLIKDKRLRKRVGEKAKETVRKKFLLTRYPEQCLDLFNSFETIYRLRPRR
jgi:hypothetical protein